MTNHRDTISRDIFQYQATGIAEEMSRALRRTAYSSIIWNMYDYSCAIFNPNGEMLSQSYTIPAQLGTMGTALAGVVETIPVDEWKPGDVLVCNDPHRGCTHTMDITLFSPIFNKGELVAISSTIAHHIDIGGAVPCSASIDFTEVYGEGFIFPPLRLVEEGKPNKTAFDLLAANVRDPRACLGDLRAQIAGCRTAERRISELAEYYGNANYSRLAREALDYGEAFARKSISGFADGRYEAEVSVEDGIAKEENLLIKVAIEVSGDSIEIDFSGTSAQRSFALNCPWSSTVSLTNYAMKTLTAVGVPLNDGFNRPVTIKAPKGSLLNPERPAAVAYRHFIAQSVANVVLKAMAPLAPEASAAGCQVSFPWLQIGGKDDRPAIAGSTGGSREYIIADVLGGGMGGNAGGDGVNAVDVHGSNCSILSAEVMETFSPIRVLRSSLVPGSGGDGVQRGGLAVERDYELLSEEAMFACNIQQASERTAPWGLNGGRSGSPSQTVLNPGSDDERVLPAHFPVTRLRKGDVVRMRSAGGGGFGDPAQRDSGERDRDRREGYVPSN